MNAFRERWLKGVDNGVDVASEGDLMLRGARDQRCRR